MKKIIVLACVFLAVVFFAAPSRQQNDGVEPNAKKKDEYPFRKNLLELHNKERSNWDFKPLEMNEALCGYAQKHAEKMAKEERLKHSRMSDLQKVNGSGYVGENIARGQKDEVAAVDAWMWSPVHRWNILGSVYKKVGFGVAKDSDGRIYWCVVFGD